MAQPIILHCILPFLVLPLLPHPTSAQQIGSFFTAIYLNGAPVSVSSYQSSCSNMGQPNYGCPPGQSCAWDDQGKVACCAAGSTCQGSAYGAGVGAPAGQYYTSQPSIWQPQQQTITVYQSATSPDTNGAVVPIVPITQATLLTSYTPATTTTTKYSQYSSPTTTYQQTTTTVPPATAAGVTSSGICSTGYSTILEANVGLPTRTVGCLIIVNSGTERFRQIGDESIILMLGLSLVASIGL